MKKVHRGFEIEVKRAPCLAGYALTYFSVMRQSDGWFMVDSFTDGEDTLREMVAYMKTRVDVFLANPLVESEPVKP